MAFDPSRLFTQLLNTGLQNKDNPLYQLIYSLIKALTDLYAQIASITGGGGGGGGGSVTINNTTIQQLMASQQQFGIAGGSKTLLMGIPTGLTGSGSSSVDHVVMSDGATPIPEPVNDGFGNFIYVQYTP